jgi:N-hydroxyarylamine O-acetyltransferase
VEKQHVFTRQPREFPVEFEPMCLYQQTAPESHFVLHRMCTLPTPTGRITLFDRRWFVTEAGQRRVEDIDEAGFWQLARSAFHMPVP